MVDIKLLSEELSKLTILEAAELVKELEEKWGVQANALMSSPAQQAPQGEEAAPKKDKFDVILKTVGDKKIQVIKSVREITALGLKEAKLLVDSAPKAIKTGISEKEANEIKEKLAKQGATVDIN
jgi:large subunit ribosomal protein L7/L12